MLATEERGRHKDILPKREGLILTNMLNGQVNRVLESSPPSTIHLVPYNQSCGWSCVSRGSFSICACAKAFLAEPSEPLQLPLPTKDGYYCDMAKCLLIPL